MRAASGSGGVAPVAGVALLSLTVALVAVGSGLFFGAGDFGRIVWGLPGSPGLWALGFSLVGYPIARRHPANPVGWWLMAAGAASGMTLLGLGLAVPDVGHTTGPVLMLLAAWVFSVAALCTAVVFFPSGSPPSRWWWAQLGALWSSSVFTYFADDESTRFVGLPEWLDLLSGPASIVFQLSIVAGLFSLLVRWRRSGTLERLQLKWVVYSVALVGTTALVVETGFANFAHAWHLPGTVVLSIVILAVPVAMGVAMLRYRLYDIDVVVNRTLVYGALTVALGLVYFGSVVLLQGAFRFLTGQGSQLVVVVSTLAIAALFNTFRRRIQTFIDRRFYRRKYDAQKTLEAFSKRLRDELDLASLSTELRDVVGGTVQPEHVSLWLRRPAGDDAHNPSRPESRYAEVGAPESKGGGRR